jgi:hypothetical protein
MSSAISPVLKHVNMLLLASLMAMVVYAFYFAVGHLAPWELVCVFLVTPAVCVISAFVASRKGAWRVQHHVFDTWVYGGVVACVAVAIFTADLGPPALWTKKHFLLLVAYGFGADILFLKFWPSRSVERASAGIAAVADQTEQQQGGV